MQYIGARYVTKIYENSLDPSQAEWEASVNYEPLTLVTYNNGSYLSKKAVPASAGDPPSEPTYWVQTGFYNGQIAFLQNQIDTINNTDLPALDGKIDTEVATREIAQKDRNYVLVFDSYGALGVSSKVEEACMGGYHTLNVGGAGFVGAGGGSTWVQALETYLQSLTSAQLAEITDIVFMGGINDYSSTFNAITGAMSACDTMIKTYTTTARVTVIPISWSTRVDGTLSAYVTITLPAYAEACRSLGWVFVPHMMGAIHKLEYMAADGIHPTTAGAERLGLAVKNYILHEKEVDCSTSSTQATFTPETGITTSSAISTKITGDTVTISGQVKVGSLTYFTIPTGVIGLKIGTLSDTYAEGTTLDGIPQICIPTSAYIHNAATSNWELRPITIQIYYHFVYLTVEGGNIDTDGVQSLYFSHTVPLELA